MMSIFAIHKKFLSKHYMGTTPSKCECVCNIIDEHGSSPSKDVSFLNRVIAKENVKVKQATTTPMSMPMPMPPPPPPAITVNYIDTPKQTEPVLVDVPSVPSVPNVPSVPSVPNTTISQEAPPKTNPIINGVPSNVAQTPSKSSIIPKKAIRTVLKAINKFKLPSITRPTASNASKPPPDSTSINQDTPIKTNTPSASDSTSIDQKPPRPKKMRIGQHPNEPNKSDTSNPPDSTPIDQKPPRPKKTRIGQGHNEPNKSDISNPPDSTPLDTKTPRPKKTHVPNKAKSNQESKPSSVPNKSKSGRKSRSPSPVRVTPRKNKTRTARKIKRRK